MRHACILIDYLAWGRIALADSEQKLQDLLKLYLAPLLLKLGSDSVAVRNKVRDFFHTSFSLHFRTWNTANRGHIRSYLFVNT